MELLLSSHKFYIYQELLPELIYKFNYYFLFVNTSYRLLSNQSYEIRHDSKSWNVYNMYGEKQKIRTYFAKQAN